MMVTIFILALNFCLPNYKSHFIVNKLKYFLSKTTALISKKIYYLFVGENFCLSLFIFVYFTG